MVQYAHAPFEMMKKHATETVLACALCAVLVLQSGCFLGKRPHPTITASPGPAAAAAGVLSSEATSRASAAAKAAEQANAQNAPGTPQEATAGELGVVRANLPAPQPEHDAEAQARLATALAGDLEHARSQWAAARNSAEDLKRRLAAAEAAAETERQANLRAIEKMQQDFARQLQDAKDEARKRERDLIRWIFFGGGAIITLVGVGCLTVLSKVPFVGPRLGWGMISWGVGMIGAGRAVTWVLDHPVILALLIGIPAAAGIVLAYVNHRFVKDDNQDAK